MFTRLTAILGNERDCRALTTAEGRKVKEVLGSSNKSNVRKAIGAKETTRKAASFYSDTLHVRTANKPLATYAACSSGRPRTGIGMPPGILAPGIAPP